MALDSGASFNVPGVFSPNRLTICYPSEDAISDPCEDAGSQSAEVGQKRKRCEMKTEEVALSALQIAKESQVFEKLFTSELQGSAHPSVTVESAIEKDALIELLRFCYTKKLPDAFASDKEALIRLLFIADQYAVMSALEAIASALQKVADLKLACQILGLPSSIQKEGAMQALIKHSNKVVEAEMVDLDKAFERGIFIELPIENMRLALSNKKSKTRCEHTVFEMVWKWMKGNLDRQAAFPQLSSHIRYHEMTSSFLLTIQQLPETKSSEVALQIRRALQFLGSGLNEDDRQVALGHVSPLSVQGPREGCTRPYVLPIPWAAEESKVLALVPGSPLRIASVKAFGYELTLALSLSGPKKLVLKVGCKLFGNMLPPGEENALPALATVEVDAGDRGESPIEYIVPLRREAANINLTLQWDNQSESKLLSNNFRNHKLEGKLTFTFF